MLKIMSKMLFYSTYILFYFLHYLFIWLIDGVVTTPTSRVK